MAFAYSGLEHVGYLAIWLRSRWLLAAGGLLTLFVTTLVTGFAQDVYRALKEKFVDRPCSISGRIFDAHTNQPLSGVQMSLYQDQGDIKRAKEVKARVATTGLDGAFKASCRDIDRSQFPLTIALWHPRWTAHLYTGPKFPVSGEWTDVNLPVDTSTLTNRRALPVAIAPAPVGEVLRVNTIGESPAYDFRTKTFATGHHGDFSFSAGYPAFFANNGGQRGVVDLGEIPVATRLNLIEPPAAGYYQYGVDAVVGHVYVALAREGHEDDHIVFRVLDIGINGAQAEYYDSSASAKYYLIQYHYRRG